MNQSRLIVGGALPVVASWPSRALAASGSDAQALWGDAGGVALMGVAAALAWHHIALHRRDIAERWHHLHVPDRWSALHLADRLHHLQLGSSIAAALHLPRVYRRRK